jgi:hypothetical protein
MRENGFRAIGNLAQRLTAGAAKGRGGSIIRLRAEWSAIAGPELARKTRPEALLANRGRAGKVLRLRVAGASALEVQHMQGQLIERVNAYFGHRAIDDIRLVQGAIASVPPPRPVPQPDVETKARMEGRVANVKDPDLRAALARLGARVTLNRRGAVLGALGASLFAARDVRAQFAANSRAGALRIQPQDHILGKADAPLTMVEYGALTCPHCAHFHLEVLPAIKFKWLDSGQARFIYRHFPSDEIATKAAQLTECSGPENFYPAVETLFRTQDVWMRAADPVAAAVQALAGNGVTPEAAAACMLTDPPLNKVLADIVSGQALGVHGTPTLFINGEDFGNPANSDVLDVILRKMQR